MLRRPDYWSRQVEIAESVRDHRTTVVAAGNSVGKSFLAAGLILWWLLTRRCRIVVTAPTQRSVGTIIFNEIREAIANAAREAWVLPGEITRSPLAQTQKIVLAPKWDCYGFTSNSLGGFSGRHDAWLMVVVDEAYGVDAPTWRAIRTLNPYRLVVFGNPEPGNEYHRLYQRGEREESDPAIPNDERVKSIRISALESPDIDLPRSQRGLADRGFIRDAQRDWGEGSPFWDIHVLGLFPKQAAYQLVPDDWILRAETLPVPTQRSGKRILSCDPAAGVGADRSVILVRDDLGLLHLEASAFMGLPACAQRIHALTRQFGVRDESIIYDAGGLGRDLPSELERFRIRSAVAFAGGSPGPSRNGLSFNSLKAASAWAMRQRFDPTRRVLVESAGDSEHEAQFEELRRCNVPWVRNAPVLEPPIQPGFTIPDSVTGPLSQSLREELSAFRYLPGVRIGLESKDALKKRLGRSPDLADALIMSFAID